MKITLLCFLCFGVSQTTQQHADLLNGRLLHSGIDYIGSPLFALLRRIMWKVNGNVEELVEANRKMGKTQESHLHFEEFFCDAKSGPGRRSPSPPTSVHQIRPGDIDIVAAMGDSLSSANGGYSKNIGHILDEFRSISFSGGGKGNWQSYLTLPNILKEFNPKLYGYAVTDGLTVDKGSKFNIAEPMAMSRDMAYQARILIQRMRSDPKVNMTGHWKVLTILMGNNDFCSESCHYSSYQEWVAYRRKDLIKTLRIFRDNVPRLIINLVGLPNVAMMFKIINGVSACYYMHQIACHCLFNPDMTYDRLKFVKKGIELWNENDKEVAGMEEFQTNDFTVIYQPYLTNTTIFKDNEEGQAQLEFLAIDCFHFSQFGHAMSAIGIWNNMLEPIGNKSTYWSPSVTSVKPLCPTEEFPFIATKLNKY